MGNRLKELRKQLGLTLDDIQEKTGIKRGTYNNYENGTTEPKLETWQKLANFFNVSVPYLQGIADFPDDKTLLDVLNEQLFSESKQHPDQKEIFDEIKQRIESKDQQLISYLCNHLGDSLPIVYRNYLKANSESTKAVDKVLAKTATLRQALDDKEYMNLVYEKYGDDDFHLNRSGYRKYFENGKLND